jgi:hypothetical protein
MQDRMTEIYEMLAKQSNGENSRGRTKLEKSRSAFLAMVTESTKQMEEHKRKIESFSPPCPSPAIQSLPITLTSAATTITIKKKKGGDETTKIHPRQRCRRSSTTLAMLDRNLHHRSSSLSNSRRQIVANYCPSSTRTGHPNCRSKHHQSQQRRQHRKCPPYNNLFSSRCQQIKKQRQAFVWLRKRKKKIIWMKNQTQSPSFSLEDKEKVSGEE